MQQSIIVLIVFKANCGESINVLMDNGIITSPNFPNDYENLQTIKFVISVAEGSTISLIFEEFDVSILTPREFMFVYYYNEFIFRSNLMLIACMTQSQFMMGEKIAWRRNVVAHLKFKCTKVHFQKLQQTDPWILWIIRYLSVNLDCLCHKITGGGFSLPRLISQLRTSKAMLI